MGFIQGAFSPHKNKNSAWSEAVMIEGTLFVLENYWKNSFFGTGVGPQAEIATVKPRFEKESLNEACLEDARINGNEKEDKQWDFIEAVEHFGSCGKRSAGT